MSESTRYLRQPFGVVKSSGEGGFAWAACGKPLVSKSRSRSSEIPQAIEATEGNNGAVSHRLCRAVENSRLDTTVPKPRRWKGKTELHG
jgi:hypothetical protein